MDASYHRHDISDAAWELIAPYLPGQRGQWGGIAKDNRRSTQSFGCYAPERLGAIFHPTMGNGVRYTSGLSAGAEKGLGRNFWKS